MPRYELSLQHEFLQDPQRTSYLPLFHKRCLASTSTTRYPSRAMEFASDNATRGLCWRVLHDSVLQEIPEQNKGCQRNCNKRSALHCVAVCCSTYPSTTQGFADDTAKGGLYCNVLRCIAACCSVLQYIPEYIIGVCRRLGLGLLLVLSFLVLVIMRLDSLH